MASVIPFLSPHQDFEWLGGRYILPNPIREGGALIQAEVVLWLEMPRNVVVGSTIIDPRSPVPFAETLSTAMKSPAEGSPRKPAGIRVPKQELADALHGLNVPVVVAPVPELDAAFADLTDAIASTDPLATYLGGGTISPRIIARLFSAASILFRMAPWRHVSEGQVLRIDIPDLAVEGACLSVIGGAGESFGLLLFRSVEAYVAFASSPPNPPSEEKLRSPRPARETQLLSLSFDRKKDLPRSMLREISQHRWEVAGAKGYPVVMAIDADALPQPATERDVRIMTACATAFLAFFARHRDLFETDEPDPVCESSSGDDDLTVTITAPYGPEVNAGLGDLFELDEAPFEAAPKRPAVGRNDPCPCGSGKKYKKCHLNAGPPPNAGASQRHTIHQTDFRLVRTIARFASSRFGDGWLGRIGKDFEGDEASLQLFLPWAAWTALADGKRVADHFLEEKGGQLSPEERDWFDAQSHSWLSVWEVTRVEPGTVDVRDLLTGRTRSVGENEGSRLLVARDAVLTRVVDFGGASLFGGMYGRVLPPMIALEVARAVRSKLRAGKGDVEIERLQDPRIGRFMIDRWREAVDIYDKRAATPPKLENTDGDPLLFVTESFRFDAGMRSEIEKRLSAMDGVDNIQETDDENEYVFVKSGNRLHRSWENTVVGRVLVARDELRIETNSDRRAEALGRRVRDACAGLLRDEKRKADSPSSMLDAAKRDGARSKPSPPSAQEQAMLRELKEAHYREWIDTPIPALGGKTPRAATRSARSRQKLDLLLRDIENRESRLPAAERFDVARLREELGLDADR
jgi:hypothetical protein